MQYERDAQAADVNDGKEIAAPLGEQPTGHSPRRRGVLLVAVLACALLAAAGVIVYVRGGFDDRRFSAEPPACATVAPSLPLLGVDYTTKQGEKNNCGLWLPEGHPAYAPAPKIQVSYAVADADKSSELLKRLGPARQDLPGIGDEAHAWNGNVFFRVGNLTVAIIVFPRPASTQEQVHAFAADMAKRLQKS